MFTLPHLFEAREEFKIVKIGCHLHSYHYRIHSGSANTIGNQRPPAELGSEDDPWMLPRPSLLVAVDFDTVSSLKLQEIQ